MNFMSYAQNFEDVMLWRALQQIENGFYIDIGAQDPLIDSVSMAFYEHGWRGVHIEPTHQYSALLKMARPDEIVEQVAIGNGEGWLTLHEFKDTGLSTFDPETAKKHQDAGYTSIKTEVPVVSLDSVLEKHKETPIHWLKIDVEGFEKSILESWHVSTVRPWILVIESTKPSTQEQNHMEWEFLVFTKGYKFVYFDGLNRFYVHQERRELLNAFSTPPNVFDGFTLSSTASHSFYQRLPKDLLLIQAKAQQAEAKAQQAEAKARQIEAKAQHLEITLNAIYTSSSWRITAPLRFARSALKNLSIKSKRVETKFKKKIRLLLTHAKLYINRRPRFRRIVLALLARFPAFATRLRQATRFAPSVHNSHTSIAVELVNLTPRARHIYKQLKTAIKTKSRNGS